MDRIYIQPNYFYQGHTFRYHEFYAGPSIFLKRFLKISGGPYLAYNTPDGLANVNEKYYYPATVEDMYDRFEIGLQFQLSLRIQIGRHFFISGNGRLGRSLGDLRTDKWSDASIKAATWTEDVDPYTRVESERIYNSMASFGLGLGWQW